MTNYNEEENLSLSFSLFNEKYPKHTFLMHCNNQYPYLLLIYSLDIDERNVSALEITNQIENPSSRFLKQNLTKKHYKMIPSPLLCNK